MLVYIFLNNMLVLNISIQGVFGCMEHFGLHETLKFAPNSGCSFVCCPKSAGTNLLVLPAQVKRTKPISRDSLCCLSSVYLTIISFS